MTFPLLSCGALNSILFGVYGNELRRLQNICKTDAERKDEFAQNVFLAGSTAGLIHSLVACPIELVKIRLQTQNREYVLLQLNEFFIFQIDWMCMCCLFSLRLWAIFKLLYKCVVR